MGSKVSGQKSAAKKLGITWEEWKEKVNSGLLWCYFCKSWKKKEVFGTDNSRWSGKHSVCRGCNSIKSTKSRYQISRSELEGMRNKPCPICERSGKKMEVDHDHKTKKIREMLCSRCNGALGQFLDNIDLLKKAIKYLKKHNGGK